ncbi:MAG: ABC transporter permease [Acidobacteriota bacterium]
MSRTGASLTYRAALRVSLALVRLLSLLVPRRERHEWLEEWQAELLLGRPFRPLRDAGGALPDALWHAREDWRLDMFHHDVRFAVRTLLARPAFTLTVVLTLALGIGANAVIFSAVDAVVLNPFDFKDPDSIIGVGTIYPALNRELGFFERLSAPEIGDIIDNVPAIADAAAFDLGNRQIVGGDQPQNLFTAFWWHDVLPVLGLEPVLGRGFRPSDISERQAVALISDRVWRTRFGGDRGVIGSTILIDDEPFTLIGVFPPEALVYGTDLWMPMWNALDTMARNRRQYNVIARLADGATLSEANAQLEAVARRTEQEYGAEFNEYANWRLVAQTWTDVNVQTLKPAALILMGAVGFVLLLVCTNVASLLLSRSAGRQREIAVRAALGAGRVRIVRQLLTESALLALCGGVAGVLLAYVGLRWLEGAAPSNLIPTTADLVINGRVLGYTTLISLLAGVAFGLAPAVQSLRFNLQGTLNLDSGKATGSRGRHRLNGLFVAVEVALALVLLVGAGLLVSSFLRLGTVDPGVDTDNVLTMRLTLPWNKYQGAAITGFFDDLSARVRTIPGVTSVAAAAQFPPLVFSRQQFIPEGAEVGDEGSLPVAYLTLTDEAYFDTFGIALQRGRTFTTQDRPDTPLVAVINETLARTYFPGVDPIGQRVDLGTRDDDIPVAEIVGVAADTRNRGLGVDPAPEVFVSLRQANGVNNQIFLIVRTDVEPTTVLDDVRAQVAAIDPTQPIYSVRTLADRFADQFAPQRFALVMLGAFAAMAMALAAVGIYGVVSYAVADRTREIGVRIALGADRREVVRMIVRQALLPVGIGLLVGIGLSIALSSAMAGLLYEARGIEPLTLATVMAGLTAVALLASWMPARRASAVDPVEALRAE